MQYSENSPSWRHQRMSVRAKSVLWWHRANLCYLSEMDKRVSSITGIKMGFALWVFSNQRSYQPSKRVCWTVLKTQECRKFGKGTWASDEEQDCVNLKTRCSTHQPISSERSRSLIRSSCFGHVPELPRWRGFSTIFVTSAPSSKTVYVP